MFSRTLARISASLPSSIKYRLTGLRSIYTHVMAFGQSDIEIRTRAGKIRWKLDRLTSQQHLLGTYEPYMQQAFIEFVRRGDVVYDVGAHTGYHTLFCGLLVGPTGRVCSFEPNPQNIISIKAKTRLNEASQISTFPYALSDKCGSAKFDASHGPSEGRLSDEVGIEVEVRTIDSLIAAGISPVPNLIKIDVEGHEGAVLTGAMNTLRLHKPIILCDYNDSKTDEMIADILQPLSYEIRTGPPVLAIPVKSLT